MGDVALINIDPKRQVIEWRSNSEYIERRKRAESRRKLYHYSTIDALKKILQTKSLLINSVCNRVHEKTEIGEDFQGLVFTSSFTHSNSNGKRLWKGLGKNRSSDVRLSFKYDNPFHSVLFDQQCKVKAFSKDGKLLDELGFNITSFTSTKIGAIYNFDTPIKVDVELSDVVYYPKSKTSNINREDVEKFNLSKSAKSVNGRWEKQAETRIIAMLRSAREITSQGIDYLLIPINFDAFDLELEFSDTVSIEEIEGVQKIIQNQNLNRITVC